jgi:hypothetical protein
MGTVTQRGKPFVYGRFLWPTGKAEAKRRLRPPLPLPPFVLPPTTSLEEIAIEVLREFSPTELIGKVYYKSPFGTWAAIDQGRASLYGWYKWFFKVKHDLVFNMDGSGPWEVLHFRNESDESGPYVAVALKFSSKKYLWLHAQL